MAFLSGYRTKITVVLLAVVESLRVGGTLTDDQARLVQAILTAAGLYFARVGAANDAAKAATSAFVPKPGGGLPPLAWLAPFLLVGLLGIAGCVSPAVHANAAKLQTTLDVLSRATIPDPRYSDPAAPEYNPRAAVKVDELWAEAQSSVAAILEASK